jgi:hypothetical protein
LDVLELPLLEFEISPNRFIQKISPISAQHFGQSIKRIHLIGINLEADQLLFRHLFAPDGSFPFKR